MRLMSTVSGSVGCKIGPSASPADVVRLCSILDPDREPGRLVLIARLGRGNAEDLLGQMAAAVVANGHRVVWLSDPMHGNTVSVDGVKTRSLADMTAEAIEVGRALSEVGVQLGGLHLEATPEPVTECLGVGVNVSDLEATGYQTLCDPRLNPDQVQSLVSEWLAGVF